MSGNLSMYHQDGPRWNRNLWRTRGDVSISLQASLYRTVGEFFENSSEVRAYRRRAENPAPKRITTRFPVLEAVRTAYQRESTVERRVCATVSVMTAFVENTHLSRRDSALTTFSRFPRSAVTGELPIRTVLLCLLSGFRASHPEFVRASRTRGFGG